MERNFATPPLAVEVMSPNDRINTTMRNMGQLLTCGVPVVWIVDLESRDVSICRSVHGPELLTDEDTLRGEDGLADFECRVTEFFASPAEL